MLGEGQLLSAPISVIREGSVTRSGLEVVDETGVFEGGDNTLFMQQVYTRQFQCKYNLKEYPFDTHGKKIYRIRIIFFDSRFAQ